MNNFFKYFRWKRSKASENSHGNLYWSYAWDIWLTWWQIYYVIGDGQWYLFSHRMLQLVRTPMTFGSIVLFLRWILSKFVRFLLEAIFEFWELRARYQKCYQTRRYISVYRISSARRIPVHFDISIYWFTPNLLGHLSVGVLQLHLLRI